MSHTGGGKKNSHLGSFYPHHLFFLTTALLSLVATGDFVCVCVDGRLHLTGSGLNERNRGVTLR